MADQYGQAQVPLEQQTAPRPSLRMLYARYMPELLGGGDFGGADVRLPMEAGTFPDPRLPKPEGLDAIRQGWDVFKDLGRGEQPAPRGTQPAPRERGPSPSVDELRRRMDRLGVPQ